jgi:hypothetical protein
LLSEAAGGDFATGALAAGANEALIEQLSALAHGDDNLLLMASQLVGVAAAGLTDGDAQLGADIAKSSSAYNFLNHRDVEELDAALKECKSNIQCEKDVRTQFQERSAANNERLNNCSVNGNCAEIQLEIQQGLEALANLSGLSSTAEGIVGLMLQGQEGDLNAVNTRITVDAANHKRDQELAALGNDPEKLALTAKAQAFADYQASLEQELLANEDLAHLAAMSDAQLDELAPGWREYQQQVLSTAQGIAQGMALIGEAIEPGLLDALGPTAKAAKLAGIFQAMSKMGKAIPDSLLTVASKLDGLVAGKVPSASELAPFELNAQAKLAEEIRKANLSLAGGAKGGDKVLWGSWKDYPKVSEGGKTYAQVGDRLYTEHAVNRMQPSGLGAPSGEKVPGRNVSPNLIDDVIRSGQPVHTVVDGVPRTVYWSGNVGVVTENSGKLVVTILRRASE